MTYDQLTDMLHWLEGGMIDTAIAEVKSELAKPEPIYIMGNYAGEGKVVNTSFGLPKGAFEFAPYTGKGEESKIKHSLEPKPEFDTPESHIVKWSIPVDPNNFGEPLAQPAQEPVAYIDHVSGKPKFIDGYVVQTDYDIPLYTTPSKQWVGLTEDEIIGHTCECVDDGTFDMNCAKDFANFIQETLKRYNT